MQSQSGEKSEYLHGVIQRSHSFFMVVFRSTEGPDLTHVTEIGNYTTTAIPTYQLIDVCFGTEKAWFWRFTGTQKAILYSLNLVTVLKQYRVGFSEHDGFKRRKI